MTISFLDLYSLDPENVAQICEEIDAAELSPEEMVAIAHELDKISSHFRQPRRTISENFRQLVDSLVKTQRQSGYEKGWVRYRIDDTWQNFKCLSLEDWQYLAKKLGYEAGWAQYRFEEAQD